MAQFVNQKAAIVTEAIEGLVGASGGRLARLDGFPHIRVVLRADRDNAHVALVSGGGSGHEPAHAGFVGPGMLTAAVCGDVFASPSVDAVLAGILAVTGPAGCLLIVKNYTGDRLNFGLAAEKARAFGLRVNMVIVDDDISLPDLPQARGLAGTLLVHKVAGTLAENGASLDEVTRAANRVIAGLRSFGMSLDTCNVPGTHNEARIPEGMVELGLGIHGEAGVEQVRFEGAAAAMALAADRLAAQTAADQPHVAMLNNLGGTSELEMQILARELMNSKIGGRIRHLIGPASMMTSLDMRGFSVTLYPASSEELIALSAETPLRAWPGVVRLTPGNVEELPDGLRPIKSSASHHEPTRAVISKICEILIEAEADLNLLDARAGDGDTGSTLAGAARAMLKAMPNLPLADHTQLYRAIAVELSEAMGGSSGVLLAIFFAAAGDAASSGASRVEMLRTGLLRMQEIGGASPGDRTMIDALAPALAALEQGLDAAAAAARQGADLTAGMTRARAGRSAYLGAAQLEGHTDPGAEAVARVFEQLARHLGQQAER